MNFLLTNNFIGEEPDYSNVYNTTFYYGGSSHEVGGGM